MFGRVWGEFGGGSLCCLWESFVSVWVSNYVLCVGQFGAGLGELFCAVCERVWCGFGGVSLCCVCESLGLVLESEIVLCV